MNITPERALLHRDLHKMCKKINQRLKTDGCTGIVFIAFNDDLLTSTAIICNPATSEEQQITILTEILKLILDGQYQRLRIGGDEA